MFKQRQITGVPLLLDPHVTSTSAPKQQLRVQSELLGQTNLRIKPITN